MRIKLDENLPEGLAELLRSAKYDVSTALEQNLGGAKDPVVTAAVKQEGRVFMTYDLDFADIRKHPPGSHGGIVVFRLQDQRWRVLEKPARRLIGFRTSRTPSRSARNRRRIQNSYKIGKGARKLVQLRPPHGRIGLVTKA